jgi:hypothetical protein
MSIKIIEDGPEIVLTRTEHEVLYREWEESQKFTSAPASFETWLRRKKNMPQTLQWHKS